MRAVSATPDYVKCLDIVERLYKQGVPVKEIAKHCNNSMSTVYKALNLLEEMGRITRRKGRYKGHRPVTEEEAKLIADLYKSGHSIYSIAKRLGRPESTIYYVLRRQGLLGREKEGRENQ